MPDDAEPQPWHGLYWRAWEALRFDRQYMSMGGELPISYAVISGYAKDNGIAGCDFWMFHRLMTAVDLEWLEHQSKKTGKV